MRALWGAGYGEAKVFMNAQNYQGWVTKGCWASYCKRYGLALILTLGALVLRQNFTSSFQNSMTFAFSSIAIALSAWLGGLGPGLFATAISTLLTLYWFIEPRGSFAITSPLALGTVGSLLIIGGLLSLIMEAAHRSQRQAGEQADRFRTVAKSLIRPPA